MPGVPPDIGDVVAAGDVNGDGADDLAIGAPRDSHVTVLRGAIGGLTTVGSQLWTQGTPGVPGARDTADRFGSSLSITDHGRSNQADLAIGVPGERAYRGVVDVLYGSPTGLSSLGAQAWSQASVGVRGTAEKDDSFGAALAP